MSYYRNTFVALLLFVIVSLGGLFACTMWRDGQELVHRQLCVSVNEAAAQRDALAREERARHELLRPLKEFSKAWEPHLRPAPAKDVGNFLRNALATLATRTGLTSEGATVPAEPRAYAVGGSVIRVQQVSLNVVSESLPAIVTWLGAVEERFPYARVESLALSGYASRSVQLSVTLLQPVEDGTVRNLTVGAAPRKNIP